MDLQASTVWVTGASAGIGQALVPALVQAGARVIATARRQESLEALENEHGRDKVVAVPGDLMDPSGLEDLHGRARDAFGSIDVLINNAGRSQRASALETGMDDVRALMELNFMAPVALTRLVAPDMIERGLGCICVVSSVAGYVSTPMRSTYNATKFAVRGWFDALRAELHGTGVGVTVVVPGYIRTEISQVAVRTVQATEPDPVERGLPAQDCAATIVRALARDKPEVHIGGAEVAGIYASRWFPGLLRRFAPRFAP